MRPHLKKDEYGAKTTGEGKEGKEKAKVGGQKLDRLKTRVSEQGGWEGGNEDDGIIVTSKGILCGIQ